LACFSRSWQAFVKGDRHVAGGPRKGQRLIRVEQDLIAFAHLATQRFDAAQHRNAHRPRHDHHMRGQRAFFQHHTLQAALVIFEQFGRAKVARNQDGILTQAHAGRRAQLARHDAQQAVGEILQIVHPVGQQRVVDLAHAHTGALLHALDRGLCGQAGIDRLVDAAAPAFVIGEHR
jgi:hypothetical protein